MPKFYCEHCGQHIDASDELAGSHASCPTCGGEIDVPSLAESKVPSTPTKPTLRRSGFWSTLPVKATIGAGAFWLLVILIRPNTMKEQLGLSTRGFATIVGETIVGLFVTCLGALLIALVIAGMRSALKKSFKESLSRAYVIGVLSIAGLILFGIIISPRNNPPHVRDSNISDEINMREAISEIEEDIQSMLVEGFDPDGSPQNSDFRFDSANSESNDISRLINLTQSVLNDLIVLQNEYLQALEREGINNLLNADRMADDADFTESRRTLAGIKDIVRRTRQKAFRVLADFPERIKEHELPITSEKEILESYQESINNTLPLFREMWDLEVESVQQTENLINHLEATRNQWVPDQGKFIFYLDQDLEDFNQIMAKITNCVNRQSDIREKSLKSSLSKIEKLKKKLEQNSNGN